MDKLVLWRVYTLFGVQVAVAIQFVNYANYGAEVSLGDDHLNLHFLDGDYSSLHSVRQLLGCWYHAWANDASQKSIYGIFPVGGCAMGFGSFILHPFNLFVVNNMGPYYFSA